MNNDEKSMRFLLFDIGGATIKWGVVNVDGIFLSRQEIKTEAALGGQQILTKVKQIITQERQKGELSGIAIATAGIIDSVSGEIVFAGPLLPQYSGINFKLLLERQFAIPVEVENDVNCMGLAESISGAGEDGNPNLCLSVGAGIGGCLVIDQQIYRGFSNSSCEIGYMNLPGGEFQDMGGTNVLCRRVAKQLGDSVEAWSSQRIFAEAENGNEICREAIIEMTGVLGQGIANLCYVLNPQLVIIGGEVTSHSKYLKPLVDRALGRYLLPIVRHNTDLVFAHYQNDAGLIGAFYHFIMKHPYLDKTV
ncbi:ROK family protein [Lapidilactobacillus luobeiensis]|uniref:ROK family protein n=1 Tax=Lapidilactobacillus luobeiensis TaxID=2950371 RepID=UPI0021C2E022|nr:ROK family protein [Lapidilactobacillus luobeiensis]